MSTLLVTSRITLRPDGSRESGHAPTVGLARRPTPRGRFRTLRRPWAPAALGPAHLHGFVLEYQQHDKWCWAAVAVSIAHFFRTPVRRTQCELADLLKPPGNCCSDPVPSHCNDTESLITATAKAGVPVVGVHGVPSVETIHTDISNDLPVGWLCEWDTYTVHFAVVDGIQPSAVTHVDVVDPAFGWSNVALLDLIEGRYMPSGATAAGGWTDTYFTSRPAPLRLRRLVRGARRMVRIPPQPGRPR